MASNGDKPVGFGGGGARVIFDIGPKKVTMTIARKPKKKPKHK